MILPPEGRSNEMVLMLKSRVASAFRRKDTRVNPSRREALARMASASASLAASYLDGLAAQLPCADPATAGTLVGTLPLSRAGAPVQPYGVKFGGRGLDARLVTDLSRLEPDRLITPNAEVFVRTDCPAAVAQHRGPWRVKTTGLVRAEGSLTIEELQKSAKSMGPHLCECSGNNNPANFGLMSVAEWDGVPLVDVLSRLEVAQHAAAVLVGGVDHHTQKSSSSTAGAARSRAAGTAGRAWLVRVRVDQVGRRDSPGGCGRTCHQSDERVRRAHSSVRAT